VRASETGQFFFFKKNNNFFLPGSLVPYLDSLYKLSSVLFDRNEFS